MITSPISYMTSWNSLYPAAGLMNITSYASSLSFSLLLVMHILDLNTREILVLSYEVLLERTFALPIFIEMSNRSIYSTWIIYLIFQVKVSIDTRRLTKHLRSGISVFFSLFQTVVQVWKRVIRRVSVAKTVRYTLFSLLSLQVSPLDENCY